MFCLSVIIGLLDITSLKAIENGGKAHYWCKSCWYLKSICKLFVFLLFSTALFPMQLWQQKLERERHWFEPIFLRCNFRPVSVSNWFFKASSVPRTTELFGAARTPSKIGATRNQPKSGSKETKVCKALSSSWKKHKSEGGGLRPWPFCCGHGLQDFRMLLANCCSQCCRLLRQT